MKRSLWLIFIPLLLYAQDSGWNETEWNNPSWDQHGWNQEPFNMDGTLNPISFNPLVYIIGAEINSSLGPQLLLSTNLFLDQWTGDSLHGWTIDDNKALLDSVTYETVVKAADFRLTITPPSIYADVMTATFPYYAIVDLYSIGGADSVMTYKLGSSGSAHTDASPGILTFSGIAGVDGLFLITLSDGDTSVVEAVSLKLIAGGLDINNLAVATWHPYVADSIVAYQDTDSKRPAFVSAQTSLDFDGTDDFMWVFDSETVPAEFQALDNNITIGAWINADAVTGNYTGSWGNYYTIIELREEVGVATDVPFNFGINNSRFSLGVTDNYLASYERVVADTTPVIDIWYHFAVTISGNNYVFYIDGEPDGAGTFVTATGERAVGAGNCNLAIGCRTTNTGTTDNYFDGEIDELFLIDQTLNDNQIRAIYNRGRR